MRGILSFFKDNLSLLKDNLNTFVKHNFQVNCDDSLDLFSKPTEGKLIICTHYFNQLDHVYFGKFLEKNIDIINPNEKFYFVMYNMYNSFKFGNLFEKMLHYFKPEVDLEKLYYYLHTGSFDNNTWSIVEKKNISKNRTERIKEALINNNNVVMFINGTKLSKKLFSIIKELNLKEMYLVEMKLQCEETHAELSKLMEPPRNSGIKNILKMNDIVTFLKNSKNRNDVVNINIQNVKIDSNEFDFEQYKKISNNFLKVSEYK